MIDIHSHILCRFDDGPRSLDESIKLLESCRDAGITEICATSHYYSAHMAYEEFTDRRARRMQELENAAQENGIDIKIIPSAEVHMTSILLNLTSVKELCYGNTSYMLLEIPHNETDFDSQSTLIDRIISYYNIKPVIAHIERYGFFVRNQGNVGLLRKMGCLMQIDADSLLKGSWIQKHAVLKLIKSGYVDFVASDCHGKERYQNLADAYRVIESKLGKGAVSRFDNNAKLLLTDCRPEEIAEQTK